MSRKRRSSQPLLRFAFLVYIALMIWLLFGRTTGWVDGYTYEENLRMNVNFQPLFTIRNYLQVILRHTNEGARSHCIINLVGNVIMFLPAGLLLPAIFPSHRNFLQFTVSCLAGILLIELIQLLTLLGSFDIDDVILNMFGLLIGYLAYTVTHLRKK